MWFSYEFNSPAIESVFYNWCNILGVDKRAHLRATDGRYSVATVWRLNYNANRRMTTNYWRFIGEMARKFLIFYIATLTPIVSI